MKITSLIQLKALEALDNPGKPGNIVQLSRTIEHDYIALARHLRVLEKIGLISMKKEGRQIFCSITPQGRIMSRMIK